MKTPAPQRAAGRRKLAAKGQALAGGTAPIPDVPYLKKAIKAVGRVDPAKRPALKRLIRKRAKELGAVNAPGVKGTWPFRTATAMANDDPEAITLAAPMPRRMPMVRGAADVQMRRTGPGAISVQHKSTGARVGSLVASGRGYAGVHADGTKTPPSGSQQGALAGLIAYHNRKARNPAAKMALANPASTVTLTLTSAGHDGIRYRYDTPGEQMALDLAAAMPRSTPVVTSGDGPRVTTVSGSKPAATAGAAKLGLSAEAAAVYAKLRKKGLSHGAAMSMAKRAAAMHAKASAKAA